MYRNQRFNKSGFSEKVRKFFDGRGFYIALSLCAVAIIAVTYITVKNSVNITDELPSEILEQQDETENSQQASQNVTGIPAPEPAPSDQDDTENAQTPVTPTDTTNLPAESAGPEKIETDTKPVSSQPTEPTETSIYVFPVSGTATVGFSGNDPVYSQTMKDWRPHQGADFEGKEGTKVKAFSAGTVDSVYNDDLMGYTVVIAHENEMYSVYQNLQEGIPVKEGDKVKAGDVIGGIGRSAGAEYLDNPHLHFEIIKDGIRIDPVEFIEKN